MQIKQVNPREYPSIVIPAQAGIQGFISETRSLPPWTPACAGVTMSGIKREVQTTGESSGFPQGAVGQNGNCSFTSALTGSAGVVVAEKPRRPALSADPVRSLKGKSTPPDSDQVSTLSESAL